MKRDTGDEIATLKAATREAHVAAQELADVIKEARKLQAELRTAADQAVGEMVKPVVAEGLEHFHKTLNMAIEDATEQIYKRFDIIKDILLGEDKASRRRGVESLQELAEMDAARAAARDRAVVRRKPRPVIDTEAGPGTVRLTNNTYACTEPRCAEYKQSVPEGHLHHRKVK